jgi:transcriptional regulator with XRE-family HTH domain
MPARNRTIGPEVSRKVAANIRSERLLLGWSVVELSSQMSLAGYPMSAAVISNIEMGIPSGGSRRTRMVSVDEAAAFAEVLDIPVAKLLE